MEVYTAAKARILEYQRKEMQPFWVAMIWRLVIAAKVKGRSYPSGLPIWPQVRQAHS